MNDVKRLRQTRENHDAKAEASAVESSECLDALLRTKKKLINHYQSGDAERTRNACLFAAKTIDAIANIGWSVFQVFMILNDLDRTPSRHGFIVTDHMKRTFLGDKTVIRELEQISNSKPSVGADKNDSRIVLKNTFAYFLITKLLKLKFAEQNQVWLAVNECLSHSDVSEDRYRKPGENFRGLYKTEFDDLTEGAFKHKGSLPTVKRVIDQLVACNLVERRTIRVRREKTKTLQAVELTLFGQRIAKICAHWCLLEYADLISTKLPFPAEDKPLIREYAAELRRAAYLLKQDENVDGKLISKVLLSYLNLLESDFGNSIRILSAALYGKESATRTKTWANDVDLQQWPALGQRLRVLRNKTMNNHEMDEFGREANIFAERLICQASFIFLDHVFQIGHLEKEADIHNLIEKTSKGRVVRNPGDATQGFWWDEALEISQPWWKLKTPRRVGKRLKQLHAIGLIDVFEMESPVIFGNECLNELMVLVASQTFLRIRETLDFLTQHDLTETLSGA